MDSAHQNAHQRHRRKTQSHFGQREEGVAGRNHDVAAGSKREPAADAAAMDQCHGRLREVVQRAAHARQRDPWRRGRRVMSADVGAGAEMLSRTAQDKNANGGVGGVAGQDIEKRVEHRLIIGIAFFRPIEGNGDDAAPVDLPR